MGHDELGTAGRLILTRELLESVDKFESSAHRIRGIRRVPREGDNEPEIEFLVAFNAEEFQVLKALFQNPHDAYQTNEKTMAIAEDVFNDIKDVY